MFSFDTECSYDEETIKSIEMNRKKLEGLFIEKVMKLMGIKRRERILPSPQPSSIILISILFSTPLLPPKNQCRPPKPPQSNRRNERPRPRKDLRALLPPPALRRSNRKTRVLQRIREEILSAGAVFDIHERVMAFRQTGIPSSSPKPYHLPIQQLTKI